MQQQLNDLQGELGFVVQVRDVDSNPIWLENYHNLVPILLLGNLEICRYYLDLDTLLNTLRNS